MATYSRQCNHRVAVCVLVTHLFLGAVVASAQESPCAAIHTPHEVAASLKLSEPYTLGWRVPDPEEPILILLKTGHPDLEAALCASVTVQSNPRQFLCISPPPVHCVNEDVPAAAVMYAWRGLWFIGAYEEGDIDLWIESVSNGTVIPTPEMSTDFYIANIRNLRAFASQTWALIAVGDYDRAREAAQSAWSQAEDSTPLLGLKYTMFLHMWEDLMLADPDKTRPYLQAELRDSTLEYRERLGHPSTLRDIAELSKLLERPQVLARAIRDTTEGTADADDAFRYIRDASFDFLYEGNCRSELYALLSGSVAEFLSDRLKSADEFGVQTRNCYTDKPDEVMAYKRQLLGRCAKLCLEQGDGNQLAEIFESALSNMKWAGVDTVLTVCMEAGPPSPVGRHWAERVISGQSARSVQYPERAKELRAWLEATPADPGVAPESDAQGDVTRQR